MKHECHYKVLTSLFSSFLVKGNDNSQIGTHIHNLGYMHNSNKKREREKILAIESEEDVLQTQGYSSTHDITHTALFLYKTR